MFGDVVMGHKEGLIDKRKEEVHEGYSSEGVPIFEENDKNKDEEDEVGQESLDVVDSTRKEKGCLIIVILPHILKRILDMTGYIRHTSLC